MWVLASIYRTVVDALFPLSKVEEELLTLSSEEAYVALPKAPPTPVPDTYSVFAYKDEHVAKLVWNIKYKKSQKAVEIGGYALHQKLMELNLPSDSIIVPIPITGRRRRERGFNQCELVLDEIERLDIAKHFSYSKDVLVRTHHVSRQTLKGRADRLESAKGIFSVNNMYQNVIAGKVVIIIDDVITTGSTIKEAMDTLKLSSAKKVIGLSIAH